MDDSFLFISVYTYKAIYSLPTGIRSSNALALYLFYYNTAKYQNTGQPSATSSFVEQELGWSNEKVRNTKRDLRNLGLIKDIQVGGTKGKAYIKIRYMTSEKTLADLGIDFNPFQ